MDAYLFSIDQGTTRQTKTDLLIDPYFSATKIMWLLDYIPEARKKAGWGNGTLDLVLQGDF